MASTQKGRMAQDEIKTSGLASNNQIYRGASETGKSKRGGKKPNGGDVAIGHRSFSMRMLVVDLVLLVLLAGLIVGAVFGYRAIKELYAPAWQTRQVEFCVRIDVDKSLVYEKDAQELFEGYDIWCADRNDGGKLGVVTQADLYYTKGEEKGTVYLTVRSDARYRKGEGYFVGDTRLLAGDEGTYRIQGVTADGVMISMHEAVAAEASRADT